MLHCRPIFQFEIGKYDGTKTEFNNIVLGNAKLLTLSPTLLKKKFVCQFHFKQEHILSTGRLVRGTVPISYRDMQVTPVPGPSSSPLAVLTPKRKYEVRNHPECRPKIRKISSFGSSEPQNLTSQEQLLLDAVTEFPSPIVSNVEASVADTPKSRKIIIISFFQNNSE